MYLDNEERENQALERKSRPEAPNPDRPNVERPEAAPATPDAGEVSSPQKGETGGRAFGRRALLIVLAVVVVVIAGFAGAFYWDDASRFESTDDAFIAARQISIAPMVSGDLASVPVTDNQHVKAGDVIATIDDRNYSALLYEADAQVKGAEASVATYGAQLSAQEAQVAQAQAQVDVASAALVFAQEQASRYEDLAKGGAGSVQNAQQYKSSLVQAQASAKNAEAASTLAQRQIDVIKAQRSVAQATLLQTIAQRKVAELNESYTTVKAAEPGRVVQLGAGVGQYVATGASLAMFVPDDIWITANFKETQLDKIRPGQPVSIWIDAYPERNFKGRVASVQPGSGTAFSLLPAENATGNYVKIVQRVPVKIIIDNPPTDVALGPGMSVLPTVRVDPTPSYWERLRAWL